MKRSDEIAEWVEKHGLRERIDQMVADAPPMPQRAVDLIRAAQDQHRAKLIESSRSAPGQDRSPGSPEAA